MNLRDARLGIVDSDLRENYGNLSLTKAIFDFDFGAGKVLDGIEREMGRSATDLFVPEYLEGVTRDRHPKVRVNASIDERCVVVSSLVSPRFPLKREIDRLQSELPSEVLMVDHSGDSLVGMFERFEGREQMISPIANSRLRSRLFSDPNFKATLMRFPWQMISSNGAAIETGFRQFRDKRRPMLSAVPNDVETIGSALAVSQTAHLERYVTLDASNGPIIVDDGAVVQSFSRITGPCYVGRGAQVKSALLRGGVSIGNQSRVSGEVEETIVSEFSNKSHEGFIGHSYVGNWVNLGALTTNSDLKNTYGMIKVNLNGREVETGTNKVGCFFSDMCKTSIGTLIYSGKFLGVGSQVMGIVFENVPAFSMYDGCRPSDSREIYLESAIDTQSRMMARRGTRPTDNFISMMRHAFEATQAERESAGVKKGRFTLG